MSGESVPEPIVPPVPSTGSGVNPIAQTGAGTPDPVSMALEIGRLREKVEAKDREIHSLSAANKAANTELVGLRSSLRRAEMDRNRLVDEYREAVVGRKGDQAEVKRLRELVAKQEVTISLHSKQISGGKDGSRKTPRHQASPSSFPDVYRQPPPPFQLPQQQPLLPAPSPYHPPPTHPGPAPIQNWPQQQPNYQSLGSQVRRQRAIGPPPQPQPPRSMMQQDARQGSFNHGALVSRTREISTANLLTEFSNFFPKVEQFALSYANVPDKEKDSMMPDFVRHYIAEHTNPEQWQALLATRRTRYFAVAKILNFDINRLAFRPSVVRGFRAEFDGRMQNLRGVHGGVMPMDVRRNILNDASQLVREMMVDPDWQRHIDERVGNNTTEMYQLVEPLLAPDVALDQVRAELRQILSEATRIGVIMMQKISMFDGTFPATGPNVHFNQTQMQSRDSLFPHDPYKLSSMNLKVKLSITPVITETSFDGTSPEPKTLHYANVLLEK